MEKRYLYSLLFGLPGLFIAGVISILMFGGLAGILWLYVFGDNPWPAFAETILSGVFVLLVLALWMATILLGYRLGRRLETEPGLNRNHILISAALTILFLLLMVLQRFSLGPKSDTVLCGEFCARHGYSGSGMPSENSGNRICSCFDDAGNEALLLPLDHIAPDWPR